MRTLSTVGEESSLSNISMAPPTPSPRRFFAAKKVLALDPTRRYLGRVTCITHRKDPIHSTTIVGKPPMKDAYMGKAVERVFLPLIRRTIRELVDISLPSEASSTT